MIYNPLEKELQSALCDAYEAVKIAYHVANKKPNGSLIAQLEPLLDKIYKARQYALDNNL